jgi:hypothetical protein
MDRRSFELNYENNILFHDPALTADVRQRQAEYLAHSHPVTAEMVAQWPVAMAGRWCLKPPARNAAAGSGGGHEVDARSFPRPPAGSGGQGKGRQGTEAEPGGVWGAG